MRGVGPNDDPEENKGVMMRGLSPWSLVQIISWYVGSGRRGKFLIKLGNRLPTLLFITALFLTKTKTIYPPKLHRGAPPGLSLSLSLSLPTKTRKWIKEGPPYQRDFISHISYPGPLPPPVLYHLL